MVIILFIFAAQKGRFGRFEKGHFSPKNHVMIEAWN